MKKKVILYGGSFSPPTISHIAYAKSISSQLTKLGYDELWILPCFISFTGKKIYDPEHRVNMCKLAFIDIQNIKICDFEIKNKLEIESISIVKEIITAYPDIIFGFTLGIDSANTFTQWSGHKELSKLMEFIVVTRKGYDIIDDAWYNNAPHKLIYLDIPDISSTLFRNYI